MPIFTFFTSLLSGAKLPYPGQTTATLSGGGVNVLTLSTNDIGIEFTTNTRVSNTAATLAVLTVDGSTFNVDTALNGSYMAIVKNREPSYNVFPYISAMSFVPSSALSAGKNANIMVSSMGTRRKRQLGY